MKPILTYYGTDEEGYRHFIENDGERYRVHPSRRLFPSELKAMEQNKNPKNNLFSPTLDS